ncbi:Pentatricopeptide repeat-containing protein [Melia azedarach]|uniref:Pentatricopeptide repeat-containing protein n=1 Tax=Melia azedarach TaxID=155640 RepID=A0ACC1YET5_MELAZ|nr:Pentatricopeptide repeat-containing protein [Melia azedarach]
MAIKLSSLTFSNKIFKRVNLTATIYSLSCAKTIPVFAETDTNAQDASGFEAKIQSLRNKLCPDNLIRILDSTGDLNSASKLFKWVSLQKRFQHTADTYCKMILKLGLAGNIEEMEGICQNMVKERFPNVKEALVLLVHSFVNHFRVNEAIRVLVNMNSGGLKPSVDVFNVVLGAIVKEKRGFEDFVFVYKEMVKAGVGPNVDTLNNLLEVLFETDRIEYAFNQFRRMHKKGCSPNSRTFEIVIMGLIANNRVDDSIAVLDEMFDLGIQLELSFYTCTIPMLCRQNKLEEAIRLFKMMRASNLVADELTYEEMIRCSCENLRLDDATEILEEMIEIGLTPAVDIFVTLVTGFCEVGKFDDSVNFLEDKCGYVTSPHNAMLECCCNARKLFLAKSILLKMAERGIADCDSWNVPIRWLCENEEIGKANELLGRMIVSSILPDSATYSALVLGNCKSSNYEDALQLFRQICAKFWVLDPISYSKLVEGLCQAEKISEAAEVFCYMSKSGCSLHSSSFNALIHVICGTGNVDKAIRLRPFAYSSGCSLDAEAYCILIQSMSAQNRAKDCVLFFNLMVNAGFVPDQETMRSLLYFLANHSQFHMVSSRISKLVSESEVLDSTMYNILINGLWKEGLKSEASYLLDQMLEKGWVPDATTHRLLVGLSVGEERYSGNYSCKNSTLQDSVSDILAEGLGNT